MKKKIKRGRRYSHKDEKLSLPRQIKNGREFPGRAVSSGLPTLELPPGTRTGKVAKREIERRRQIMEISKFSRNYEHIAAVIGVSTKTLQRKYGALIKKGWEYGNMTLAEAQYQLAMAGNPTMHIWLGKQRLGQRDQLDLGDILPMEPPVIRIIVVDAPAGSRAGDTSTKTLTVTPVEPSKQLPEVAVVKEGLVQ